MHAWLCFCMGWHWHLCVERYFFLISSLLVNAFWPSASRMWKGRNVKWGGTCMDYNLKLVLLSFSSALTLHKSHERVKVRHKKSTIFHSKSFIQKNKWWILCNLATFWQEFSIKKHKTVNLFVRIRSFFCIQFDCCQIWKWYCVSWRRFI